MKFKEGDYAQVMSMEKELIKNFGRLVGATGTVTGLENDRVRVQFASVWLLLAPESLKVVNSPAPQKKVKSIDERVKELNERQPKDLSLCDQLIMKNANLQSVLHKIITDVSGRLVSSRLDVCVVDRKLIKEAREILRDT